MLGKQLQQKQQQLQLQLQQQQQQLQEAASNNEDESKGTHDCSNHFPCSDCHEHIIASPGAGVTDPISQPLSQAALKLVSEKPLPEKGKLLQAVVEAGPLLQTLLLAGPLPQWQHPPPQLNSIEIPPVAISSPTQRLVHQDSRLSLNLKGCFSNKSNAL